MKCLTLDEEFLAFLHSNKDSWYCSNCLADSLPFVVIKNDTEFQDTINQLYDEEVVFHGTVSDKRFIPFELNEENENHFLNDCDADMNYFNVLKSKPIQV